MNITEDKLKAGIQIALGTLGLYTQEAETLLIHHIKALTLTDVVCSACGAENSIRWDKHCIGIDDKQGSYKDLSFQFCEECGDVTDVDFS
jgi:hypothetical protein